MAVTTRKKYGISTWPADLDDAFIDLVCWKKWSEIHQGGNLLHPAEHLLRACRALLKPSQFGIHGWVEDLALDFSTEEFLIVLGPASSTKSNTIGLFSLLWWMVDPNDTTVLVGSTTKEALKARSWEAILRYFGHLKSHANLAFPGKHSKTGYAILSDQTIGDSDIETDKPSIRGVALADGGNLQGAHLPYVAIIVDELATLTHEGGRKSVEEALSNLRKGTRQFKFVGLANPESKFDLACRYAEPVDGWSSVSVNHESWRSKYGKVRHFDGLKSPAIVEPGGEVKYPYLIKQSDIDRDREIFGEDHPRFWTMNRGYPADQGSVFSVITETEIRARRATEPTLEFHQAGSPFFKVVPLVGLDSAFSTSGDNAILYPVLMTEERGIPILACHEPVRLLIEASSARPITYQLVDQVRAWLFDHEVPIEQLACDDSGTQSVCDVLTVEIGEGVFRVNYSTRATDKPMAVGSVIPANKRVGNLITEAWQTLVEFILAGQVRGLPAEVVQQLTSRQFLTNRGVIREPRVLEPKPIYKSRTRLGSPDETDALAQVALMARVRFGMMPGARVYPNVRGALPGVAEAAPVTRDPFQTYSGDALDRLSSRYVADRRF